MRAIGKHVIIQPVQAEAKTKSGILLSADDTEQLRYKRGVVVVEGSEVSAIKKGDEIYYDKRSGHSLIIGDDTYVVIVERDVVAVL